MDNGRISSSLRLVERKSVTSQKSITQPGLTLSWEKTEAPLRGSAFAHICSGNLYALNYSLCGPVCLIVRAAEPDKNRLLCRSGACGTSRMLSRKRAASTTAKDGRKVSRFSRRCSLAAAFRRRCRAQSMQLAKSLIVVESRT